MEASATHAFHVVKPGATVVFGVVGDAPPETLVMVEAERHAGKSRC